MQAKQRLYQHRIKYKYLEINGDYQMLIFASVEECGKNTQFILYRMFFSSSNFSTILRFFVSKRLRDT